MEENMDMAEGCNCEGCAAHMEGEEKGECTCPDKEKCKCETCGNAEAHEEPAAA